MALPSSNRLFQKAYRNRIASFTVTIRLPSSYSIIPRANFYLKLTHMLFIVENAFPHHIAIWTLKACCILNIWLIIISLDLTLVGLPWTIVDLPLSSKIRSNHSKRTFSLDLNYSLLRVPHLLRLLWMLFNSLGVAPFEVYVCSHQPSLSFIFDTFFSWKEKA